MAFIKPGHTQLLMWMWAAVLLGKLLCWGSWLGIASRLLCIGDSVCFIRFHKVQHSHFSQFLHQFEVPRFCKKPWLVTIRNRPTTKTLFIPPKETIQRWEFWALAFGSQDRCREWIWVNDTLALWLFMPWWSFTWPLRCCKKPEKPMGLAGVLWAHRGRNVWYYGSNKEQVSFIWECTARNIP